MLFDVKFNLQCRFILTEKMLVEYVYLCYAELESFFAEDIK